MTSYYELNKNIASLQYELVVIFLALSSGEQLTTIVEKK